MGFARTVMKQLYWNHPISDSRPHRRGLLTNFDILHCSNSEPVESDLLLGSIINYGPELIGVGLGFVAELDSPEQISDVNTCAWLDPFELDMAALNDHVIYSSRFTTELGRNILLFP